jgi:hypothetical protein
MVDIGAKLDKPLDLFEFMMKTGDVEERASVLGERVDAYTLAFQQRDNRVM